MGLLCLSSIACQTLALSQLDSVIIAPPWLMEGDSQTLAHLQPAWEELEALVRNQQVAAIGTSDLDKDLLEQLYNWAQVGGTAAPPTRCSARPLQELICVLPNLEAESYCIFSLLFQNSWLHYVARSALVSQTDHCCIVLASRCCWLFHNSCSCKRQLPSLQSPGTWRHGSFHTSDRFF